MSTHVALVVKVDTDMAWVQASRTTSCGGCQSESSCGVSSLSKVFNKSQILFEVKNTLGVKENDRVVVRYDDSALLKASFFAYLWPVVVFFVFAIGGTFIQSALSLNTEWPVILASFCGLLVSGLLLKSSLFSVKSVAMESKILS